MTLAGQLDTARIVRRLLRDAVGTLGEHVRAEVETTATNVAETARERMRPVEASPDWKASPGDALAEAQQFFDTLVVDQFQQAVHDEQWDTVWPACPRHPNHPLWYDAELEAWCCTTDHVAIAPLGGLPEARRTAT
jgi:hypothetical protein